MLTLEETIEEYEKVACFDWFTDEQIEVAQRCRQIAEWLRELQERRKAPEIIYCHECIHFQCNMRFDGFVPKGADAYECRHWCGGCDPMDYCSCGERAERRPNADD